MWGLLESEDNFFLQTICLMKVIITLKPLPFLGIHITNDLIPCCINSMEGSQRKTNVLIIQKQPGLHHLRKQTIRGTFDGNSSSGQNARYVNLRCNNNTFARPFHTAGFKEALSPKLKMYRDLIDTSEDARVALKRAKQHVIYHYNNFP